MLTTPLKVFVSIQQQLSKPSEYTQKLLVKQNLSSPPTLIVQNTRNGYDTRETNENAKFVYSDCQYSTPDQVLYIEQLEWLVNSTIQGYNSAGVFINTRGAEFDGMETIMVNNIVHLLRERLAKENTRRRGTGQPQISLGYGYLGFCDDSCLDYGTNRVYKNSDALQMSLGTLVGHKFTDKEIDTIISKPRRFPSLLFFHLSDGYQFDSSFAWIDLHPPGSQFGQQNYYKSYREFESFIKSWSIPNYVGTLNTYQYAMTHMLVDFFSGSYQTAVFAHLEEYGHYTMEFDLDVLVYASQLQNIQCRVTRGRRNTVQQNQVLELENQVCRQNLLLEKYKLASIEDNQEISRLNTIVASSNDLGNDYLRKRLIITKKSARAAMERQTATTEIQMADMKHQIDAAKIELVKANMIANSFRCNSGELETYIGELQGINHELSRIHDADTARMEELQAQIKTLVTRLKRSENGDIEDSGREWIISEGQYIQELHELKSEKNRLTREIDTLTVERKQLVSRNNAIRLEMNNKISRLQLDHDRELKSMESDSQYRLKQMVAEKDREIALIQDDLEFSRSQLRAALLENSTEHQQQTRITNSPSLLQPKAETEVPPSAPGTPSAIETHSTQNHPKSSVYIDLSSSSSSHPDLPPSTSPIIAQASIQPSRTTTTSRTGTVSPQSPPPPLAPTTVSTSTSAQLSSQPTTQLSSRIPSQSSTTQATARVSILDTGTQQTPDKKRRRLRLGVHHND